MKHVQPSCSAPSSVDYARLILQATTDQQRVAQVAAWILSEFDLFYYEWSSIPERARKAFEDRDPNTSLALSKQRLALYSNSIAAVGEQLKTALPTIAENETFWEDVESCYQPLMENRYESDLATAYMNSIRRKTSQGEWRSVAYSLGDADRTNTGLPSTVYRSFKVEGAVDAMLVQQILNVPGLSTPFKNMAGDVALIVERIDYILESKNCAPEDVQRIDIANAGFYRNRGAYIVGRIVLGNLKLIPLIFALLNEQDGIYVDAMIHAETYSHNLFSSTLANFHVPIKHYHELVGFLHSIMPKRPLGLHYSTIGFNHVGKVAVMDELKEELASTGEQLASSVGFEGTVAIGFSTPSSAYHLKVIRNEPTEGYKWGEFEGIDEVLKKYGQVHDINRTGSMLDNIIYYNLTLDRSWFDAALLDKLLLQASESVHMQGDSVIFRYLIVQRRMAPLPVFLQNANEQSARTAVANLGYCIKNNMAANIFNKDLDARNYGVSRFLKVYLYDYDAVEVFSDVKIRSNENRFDGEEDVPDWFFEEGVVFLPEEIEVGLRIHDPDLRRHFRAVHGDLLTTEYWTRIQNDLIAGDVPSVRVYPEDQELRSGNS